MKIISHFFQLCLILALMLIFVSPELAYAKSSTVKGSSQVKQVNCPSPPANFDPLIASNAEISYYGFPRRPQENSSEIADWLNLVKGAKHRSCTFYNSHRYSQPLNTKQLSQFSRNSYGTEYTTSPNWSGYFVGSGTGSGFKQLEGNWNIPCYNGSQSPSNSRAVSWIGLGGWYGNNLWQAGTTEDPSEGYHFWVEAFPQTYMIINDKTLSCGNHVQAEVDYNVTVPGKSSVYLKDTSNGDYVSASYGDEFVPDLESADWIDERIGCSLTSSSHYLLADFNYVVWSSANAKPNSNNSSYGSINSFVNLQVTMYETNSPYDFLTSPYSLGSGGNNFQDNWQEKGNDDTC